MAVAAHAADVAAGKQKAELCIACHGEGGISQTENIPSLAGQPDQFIQWQLVFFRAGTRKNEQMQPIVEQLNNEDIRNLGAYFASLDAAQGAKARRQSGSIPQGRAGRRGAALCRRATPTAMPGPRRSPASPASARNISLKALHDYKSGVRSGGGMAAMADVAYSLSEEEIEALAHYLAHL